MSDSKLFLVDDGRGRFGPMTALRPAFDLRTGPGLTRWRIERVLGLTTGAIIVPERLAAVSARRYEVPVNPPTPDDAAMAAGDSWLVVNGRWSAADEASISAVRALADGEATAQEDGQLIAARVSGDQAWRLGRDRLEGLEGLRIRVLEGAKPVLYERPWHVLDHLEAAFARDASLLDLPRWTGRTRQVLVQQREPFLCARSARIDQAVLIDTRGGPVIINDGAVVRAGSLIEGPAYIGAEAQVMPHSAIRPHTVVGPVCKVAGEISFTIIHGYSNKAHDGFLGHSLVGQWVNLGAGTVVSNLKNTYGSVRMQLGVDEPAEDTGRTFQGPLLGDFVRTAIGTRILTGSCIGEGSMLATSGFPPKVVAPFTFLTDEGATAYDAGKFIATAQAMMDRRHVELAAEEQALIRRLITDRLAGYSSPSA